MQESKRHSSNISRSDKKRAIRRNYLLNMCGRRPKYSSIVDNLRVQRSVSDREEVAVYKRKLQVLSIT